MKSTSLVDKNKQMPLGRMPVTEIRGIREIYGAFMALSAILELYRKNDAPLKTNVQEPSVQELHSTE